MGASCPTIIAIVYRDLDGRSPLDVIAIDADLQVYTSMSPKPVLNPRIQAPTQHTGRARLVVVSTRTKAAPHG